jgi:hypothetical protein
MTAQTTDFSGTLFYNPAGPGFSADIRATVTADTVSRPALTIYVEFYTGVPSEGPFSYMASSSDCNGTRCQVLSYEFGGVDGVITYANVLYDVNNAPRVVDDPFVLVTDPFFMSGLYGTVILKVGTIGNTGDEGNYQKFDVVSWGIQSPVGLNQLATSSSTCSVTLNGDTKHYRIESDNSRVQIDALPEHAHDPLSLASGALYWRLANLQNLTTNRFTNTSSEFFINRNRASFNVYVNADNTTAAGVQTYDVIVSKTLTGPALSTATGNVVNDTSQTPPSPTYALATAGSVTSVDEGVALTFNITTTNVADGTTLWWSSYNNFDGTGRFDYPTGSTTITSNAGSFSITVAADSTTAGAQQYYNVTLWAGGGGGAGGTQVASVENIVVNDTSQTPP